MFNRRVFQIFAMQQEFEDKESELESNRQREYRQRTDFFVEMDEANFVQRFGLSKSTCKMILSRIRDQVTATTNRNRAVMAETKLLLTLRFYASGSLLTTASEFCGVSVASASRAVKEVSHAIALLAREYINFEWCGLQETVTDFYEIAKFPDVIGAIGCTHVRIQSPGGENAEVFRNHNGYFSFNVQAVCNAKLLVTNVVARWPGSTDDSTIFNNSRLKYRLDHGEFENYYILGDGGYKTSHYMMTPLLNPETKAEKLYNQSHISTRNVIERCFGIMKRRFPVLSMGMRISQNTTMSVIVACAVLHNIAIIENDPLPKWDLNDKNLPTDASNDKDQDSFENDSPDHRNESREKLILNYFTNS